MLGESEVIADGVWLVQGGEASASSDFVDVPNVLLYCYDGRLTLMDSGIGVAVRAALLELFAEAGPAGSFTLLNSHAHVGHVANNDLIRQAPAPTPAKRHYLSRPGMELLDPGTYLARQYYLLSDYFDPLGGQRSPRWKFRLAAAARDLLAPLLGEERAYQWLVPLALGRLRPFEPSPETIRFFEDLPQETIELGGLSWEGWVLAEEGVWVLPDRAHSPDHVLFYLPEQRLLHAGDLTFDVFNVLPQSDGDAIRETIGRLLQLVEAGAVEVLTDSHHPVLRGREPIEFFLQRLLAADVQFRQVLAEIVRAHPGSTVPALYSLLRERQETDDVSAEVVSDYLKLEYPRAPGALQSVIALTLLDMGCRCEGLQRQNRFFLPVRE